jgi:hypothetical protein
MRRRDGRSLAGRGRLRRHVSVLAGLRRPARGRNPACARRCHRRGIHGRRAAAIELCARAMPSVVPGGSGAMSGEAASRARLGLPGSSAFAEAVLERARGRSANRWLRSCSQAGRSSCRGSSSRRMPCWHAGSSAARRAMQSPMCSRVASRRADARPSPGRGRGADSFILRATAERSARRPERSFHEQVSRRAE